MTARDGIVISVVMAGDHLVREHFLEPSQRYRPIAVDCREKLKEIPSYSGARHEHD